MSSEITNIEHTEDVNSLLASFIEQAENKPAKDARSAIALTNLGAGILRFADAVFEEVDRDRVYATMQKRQPDGRGPHFDIYGPSLDPNYPWLGIYNLAGHISLQATKLPDDLASSYFNSFPKIDDTASEARRDFSRIALNMPSRGRVLLTGELVQHTGLIILQRTDGPHVVHDLVPIDRTNPGEFIKLVCPAKNAKGTKLISESGLITLDELITKTLTDKDEEQATPHLPLTIPSLDKNPSRRRRPRRDQTSSDPGSRLYD